MIRKNGAIACCRCNCSGRCQNCLCVKSGRPCQGCLPQRLGKCVNTVRTPLSQVTDMAPLSPQNSMPRSSSSSPPPPDSCLALLRSLYRLLSIYPSPFIPPRPSAVCPRLRHVVAPRIFILSSLCFHQLWNPPSQGVPMFPLPSLTPSMLFIVKLYIGGLIFSKSPSAKQESPLCF